MRANGQEVYSSHELEDRKWDPIEILQVMSRPVSIIPFTIPAL